MDNAATVPAPASVSACGGQLIEVRPDAHSQAVVIDFGLGAGARLVDRGQWETLCDLVNRVLYPCCVHCNHAADYVHAEACDEPDGCDSSTDHP